MAKKAKPKMVHCRYPKCFNLHESREIKKEEAIKGGKGSSYYHPDCYHVMRTIMDIKDMFKKEIDPTLMGKQLGQVVSIANAIVFTKHVNVDYLYFALQYYITHKPGALKYPPGLHYIIQDKDVKSAWRQRQEQQIKNEIKMEADVVDEFDLQLDHSFAYVPKKRPSFADILG